MLRFVPVISKVNLRTLFSDNLTILHVDPTEEKPRVLRKMFSKLDVRRKSIVTLELS